MVCGTFTVQNVPQEDLQETIDIWLANTPEPKVTYTKNADGTYTLTAEFPPCSDNTTHDPGDSSVTKVKAPAAASTSVPQCAIDLIKRFEGYEKKLPDGRAQAYPDPRVGWNLPTIGWGTTKYPDETKVQKGDIITPERAEECLQWEIDKVCRPELEKIPTWRKMNANQQGALFSFAYNLGAKFYGDAHFLSITQVCDSPGRWNDNDWIQEQFVRYRNPGSSVEEGLRNRRKAEAQLFCSAVA